MVLDVIASQDLHAGDPITLLFNDSHVIYARKSLTAEQPDAIASREIREGEALVFDTGRDTADLQRPGSQFFTRLNVKGP